MQFCNYEDEVTANFKENPELYRKSIHELAKWFLIQGELNYSRLLEAAKARTEFYRMRLPKEQRERVDNAWLQSQGLIDLIEEEHQLQEEKKLEKK